MRVHAFAEHRKYADEDFPVSCWEGSDLRYVAHWHGEVELLFVSRGRLRMSINQRRVELGPGDLAIVGSNAIHYYEGADEACRYRIVIFSPELTGRPEGWSPRGAGAQSVVRGVSGRVNPLWADIPRLMGTAVREAAAREKAWQAMVHAALWEITARLDRLGLPGEGPLPDDRGESALDRMQKAIRYLHRNFLKPVGLAEAARAAALCPTHFSRLFSRFTGQNLSSFLNGLRVEKAKERLEGTERIVDIALACGFESVRSFNRAFKAHTGQTPRDYRRNGAGGVALAAAEVNAE